MTPDQWVRRDIAAMEPYTPIVPFDVLSRQLGRPPDTIVKLDANENPYGASPRALAALRAERYHHIYPDPESRALRAALAGYTGVPAAHIVCGMGADELIDLVLRVVLEPGDVVVDCPPSFGMYPFSTTVNAGRYVAVPRRPDFSLDVAAVEATVAKLNTQGRRVKVVFACSPNNPDGGWLDDADLERLLALPALIVLDEAYVDFAMVDGYASRFGRVLTRDNLVVLRTFSKLAGLAGLRVGYGAFPAWLVGHLLKIKQPYNVSVAAQAAATAALGDTEWLHEKVGALVAERERLSRALADLPFLEPRPSRANFVLCRVIGRDAGALKQQLADRGVLVRYFNKPGVANYIRVSAGRPADTHALLAALRAIDAETRSFDR